MQGKEEKKAKRSLRLSVIALLLAIVMTISVCLAWFYFSQKVASDPFDIKLINNAYSMQVIEINVDNQGDVNEFYQLLPGSEFKFKIKLKRKEGDTGAKVIKITFTDIFGDAFTGKDGNPYNMAQLFMVQRLTQIGSGEPTTEGNAICFGDNKNGVLPLSNNIAMPTGTLEIIVMFKIMFTGGTVGVAQIPPDIAKKKFKIGSIVIDAV